MDKYLLDRLPALSFKLSHSSLDLNHSVWLVVDVRKIAVAEIISTRRVGAQSKITCKIINLTHHKIACNM